MPLLVDEVEQDDKGQLKVAHGRFKAKIDWPMQILEKANETTARYRYRSPSDLVSLTICPDQVNAAVRHTSLA